MEIKTFFKGKRVLLTGVTGFLGKVVMEKILWEAPDLEKLVLLIRPGKGDGLTLKGAISRFENQILPSRIFGRLREREKDFNAFMNEKIDVFPCDFFNDDIGIPVEEKGHIFDGLDAIIHIAAQVSWDERIDYSIRVNTIATQRLLEYAKSASKKPRFVYISSAYVNGQRAGKVSERAFDPSQSIANELGGKVAFSLEDEIDFSLRYGKKVEAESYETCLLQKFKEEALLKLGSRKEKSHEVDQEIERLRKKHVRSILSDYGMKQANLHGWTDSYTFSKAMAEMLLVKHQEDIPLAIVRPPGITSAVKEPAPGWLEGFHLVEPLIVGVGKGLIKGFPGARESLIDTVPVDHVVNLILSSCVALEDAKVPYVYQIGNSDNNPITLSRISAIWQDYFEKNPMKNDSGKTVEVSPIKFYSTTKAFNKKISWQYVYPLAFVQNLLLKFKFAAAIKTYRDALNWVTKNKNRAERVLRFSDLYSAYTMNSWIFSSDNTAGLFKKIDDDEKASFDFDISKIDWQRYWHETHIPGMKKYVLK